MERNSSRQLLAASCLHPLWTRSGQRCGSEADGQVPWTGTLAGIARSLPSRSPLRRKFRVKYGVDRQC